MKKTITLLLTAALVTSTVLPAAAQEEGLDRAGLAQLIYQREQSPEVDGGDQPSDVAKDAEYADAVRWAGETGILSGYGDGRMGPEDALTREQLAVALRAYGDYLGLTLPEGTVSFQDAGQVSSWALPAAGWAIENGLLSLENGKLDPKGAVTMEDARQALEELGVQKANADLDAMLSDAEAPVSGYGVMAYKNGELIYQRTGGWRYLDA